MSGPHTRTRFCSTRLWRGAVTALVLLGATTALACRPATWQEFRSKDGNFKVLLPGAPTTENLTSPSAKGPLTVHLVTVQAGNQTYTVAYNDYPQSVVDHATPDSILDLAVEGALGDAGRLVSSSAISLNAHTGRTIEAALPEGIRYRANFILDHSRLYQVSILESPGTKREEDQARFLGSFEIGLKP